MTLAKKEAKEAKEKYKITSAENKLIEKLVNLIGVQCRGRIEIEGERVIEFESKSTGGWQRTGRHYICSDEAFSLFPKYRSQSLTLSIEIIQER